MAWYGIGTPAWRQTRSTPQRRRCQRWVKSVNEFVNAPEELMLFCALSIGYKDPDAPVNQLISDREPLEKFATFL